MNNTGNTRRFFAWLLWPLLSLMTHPVMAALDANVDRTQVAMGDTLQLEISATANEDLNRIDLGALQQDFDILQRSSTSAVNIVNGQRSETRKLVLEMTPRRQGELRIPPLGTGASRTPALHVKVGPQPTTPAGNAQVLFEAELDRQQVYVQGQVVLTLRVQQSINLDNRSVTELKLDNAFVKPLEQNSFQRTIDGRPWLVHEIRYAIFPEQSGVLEIPAQTFSARESQARRSLFDRSTGPLLHRETQTLQIEVLPRPDAYPQDTTWLPASNLRLEEQWSTPPEQLQAGESATRTVRIAAEGLQGAQLPPTLFPAQSGLKYYPDQPQISETEGSNGLVGQRVDSAALVPSAPGIYQIPEVRIPWWDTDTGELREAVLPAREIEVVGVAAQQAPAVNPQQHAALPAQPAPAVTPAVDTTELWLWRGVAAFCALGWLATLVLLLRRRRARPVVDLPGTSVSESEPGAYKQLMAACASHQAPAARAALQAWSKALFPNAGGLPLAVLEREAASPELEAEIANLENALFAAGGKQWEGSTLALAAKGLRPRLRQGNSATQDNELALYPT